MEREEILIERFGFFPPVEKWQELRQLLELELQTHDNSEDCGDYLRVLCFMLFYIGNAEDSPLIWKAKTLNMDTGSMIDAGLLCGAGYEQTIEFIKGDAALREMQKCLEQSRQWGDMPEREDVVKSISRYYGCKN